MIKWFCDLCGKEIEAPAHPVRVRAYRCGKNRDDVDVGWGEDHTITAGFYHEKCADVLETELNAGLRRAKLVVTNNG